MLSNDLVTQLPNGGFLLIPKFTLEQCEKHKQTERFKPESGGIFLGCYRGSHIEITDMTHPGEKDYQSKYQFVRQSNHHVKANNRAFLSSKGTVGYIGEWHTHPQIHPKPSLIDTIEWKTQLPRQPLILMIIGINSNWIGLRERNNRIKVLPELKLDQK